MITAQLIGAGITALVLAILAALAGNARGKAVGRKEGRTDAVNEIGLRTAEHTLEKIHEANDAGAAVERRTDDGVRDAAGTDPNNLGRVRRP